MSAPQVKGWCPGAHRPMMSGDGLVVRVRPRLARLDARQVKGLCDAALRFGSGTIDVTNRANLQLRGVAPDHHDALLRSLSALDLLDADATLETRRNIIVTPFWTPDDLTCRLAQDLLARLGELPDLPAKFGFAIDTGRARMLAGTSADIRLERTASGELMLRADGAESGRPVTPDTAIDRLIELCQWFAQAQTSTCRRMAALVGDLPAEWRGVDPAATQSPPDPGLHPTGLILGAVFGQIEAATLARLVQDGGVTGLRVTPWRLIVLEGISATLPAELTESLVTRADDPLLITDACPGAPFCPQAQVETRAVARQLAGRTQGSLHVSGCAKGCARNRPAAITLVGNAGRFDLVKAGRAGDEPAMRGLTLETLMTLLDPT